MIMAIAYDPNFALMATFGLSLLTCMTLGGGIADFLVIMGGTAAGVLALNEVRTRTKLIKVGATAAALGYLIMTWATGLWEHQPIELIRSDGLWRAGWGLMAGFFLGGSLPFLENAFGIVTGISLLELGDITHPLLQELVRRPPERITIPSRSGRSRRRPPSEWAPTPCSFGSAPTFTTSARCSSPIISWKTRWARRAATPTSRRP